jgi:murein L,D-transpeptidase YcbB/YkuD
MNRLSELKALAELAEQLEENGHFVEANVVHNKFMKLSQLEAVPFIAALQQNAPNFVTLLRQAPAMYDVPTFAIDNSNATVALVQELLGLPADGAIGKMTLSKMAKMGGALDSALTAGFRRKFNIQPKKK